MNPRCKFWAWWLGNRFVWIFIPTGIIACLLFPLLYSDVRFLLHATPESGKIMDFGIQSGAVAGSSVNRGSWQKINHSPWIDVESISLGTPCRIEGQLGVFGGWLSDEKPEINQALKKITEKGEIHYYIEKETTVCRSSRAIDFHSALIFFVCLIISLLFGIWSCHAILHNEFHEKNSIDNNS